MPSEVLLRGKVSWYIGDVDADIPAAPNLAIVPADWTAIGEPYIDDDGVQFALPSTQEDEMVNGQTLPVDSYRTFEQPSLGGNVKDFSAEVLSKALNSNTITTAPPTAANAGYREVNLERGPQVTMMAVLCRIEGSPYDTPNAHDAQFNTDIYLPRCCEGGGFESALGAKQTGMVPLMFKGYKSNTTGKNHVIRMVDLAHT